MVIEDHAIFVLEIEKIKRLYGLFLYLLNMKSIKKSMKIRN